MNKDRNKCYLQEVIATIALFVCSIASYSQHGQSSINYADKVNALIGNKGKGASRTELQFEAGFSNPGATYPFGMVQFTPTFFAPDKGFVVNQLSGAGCPNMGNFPTLPLAGDLKVSPDKMDSLKHASHYNQGRCRLLPGKTE